MQIYQDTYCKGHIHTALPGTCMSQGKGLETHQGQRQLHIGSDYCIWKARKKESQKTVQTAGQVKTLNDPSSINRSEEAEARTSASAREALQRVRKGWWQTPMSSSAYCQKGRSTVAQPLPLQALLTAPAGISLKPNPEEDFLKNITGIWSSNSWNSNSITVTSTNLKYQHLHQTKYKD